MLKVVIPDPGLREFGGHHPAMVASLSNSTKVVESDLKIDVYSNKEIASETLSQIETKNVVIKRHFETDFYKYFYQDLTLVEMNTYIVCLTKEYLALFNQYVEYNEKDLFFLYHTLHWEHAVALASAITIFEKQTKAIFRHCVFLMFNPEKFNQMAQLNIIRFMNFKVAFSLLNSHNNVSCFAGEHEVKAIYQQLLNTDVALHPCGLLSREVIVPRVIHAAGEKNTIILFTGDVKANKGFLQLPELVQQITRAIKLENVTFLIQYTLTSDNPDLAEADSKIKEFAKGDKRITLVNKFWSHKELHQNFDNANMILFNYEHKIYKNQSSGVLWLAAFYNLKMFFMTDTWLNREAKRLSSKYEICMEFDVITAVKNHLTNCNSQENKQADGDESKSAYRESLFQDTSDWLYKKYNKI